MANASTHSGSAISTAVATDPDLCRVSGYLRNIHGNPLVGIELIIRHCYSPIAAVGDALYLQERLTVRTDANGYVEFDLLRKSKVYVEMPNLIQDYRPTCIVPDASSIDLVDFVFPTVESLAWDDAGPLAVNVDEAFTVGLTGTLTNGETIAIIGAAVTLSSSNEVVVRKDTSLSFTALAVGVALISVDALDLDLLGLNAKSDGTVLVLLDVPTPSFPTDITVNVS
jgi:hypothetical protein